MRPFIILELLIAFALVSASTLPLIRYPIQHLAREIDALFLTEISRLAEADLAQIRIDYIQGKINPDSMEKGIPHSYSREKLSLSLPGDLKRIFEKKVTLMIERKKETKEGEVALLKALVVYCPLNARKAILQAETIIFCERGQKA